ncbi:MAG: hypothetical protein EBU52_03440 [Cytophagia bacterium]|jgi:hypothetical protein|nr:hypothetical protein [Cytophagia bacterium]
MESPLQKLKPQHVVTALAMTGVDITEPIAAIVQDVIHALIEKQTEFSLEDATEIMHRHKPSDKSTSNQSQKLKELSACYRVLSECYVHDSKSKINIAISDKMDHLLREIELLRSQNKIS